MAFSVHITLSVPFAVPERSLSVITPSNLACLACPAEIAALSIEGSQELESSFMHR